MPRAKPTSAERRLRKYARKKARNFGRWHLLYWRYHHTVHGKPVMLWEIE